MDKIGRMSRKEYQEELKNQMFPDGRIFSGNPMVVKFGPDKKGRKCAECKLLFYWGNTRKYYKCKLRGATHGKATDHGKYYPACSKLEERKKNENIDGE